MSAEQVAVALAILAVSQFYALHLIHRGLQRRDEWIAALTRRVWKLEGSPACDCGAEDCQ